MLRKLKGVQDQNEENIHCGFLGEIFKSYYPRRLLLMMIGR